jgi:photosystem II stability/assembly factor-like uncharacterized protein
VHVRTLAVALLSAAASAAALPGWHQVSFPYPVSAVAVASDSEAWAAGTAGSYLYGFLQWDGGNWTLADTFRNQLVYDICYAGSDAWAVGEQFNVPDGIVYRWNGEHWQQQTDPFDRALQAVAFSDSAHGYAGGAAPVTEHPVMKYTDGEWRLDSALTTRRIICGIATPWYGKCYAVGDSGAILLYDYGTWKQKQSPTTRILRRVAMESNTEGWAVGDGGTILRCFKDSWTLVPSPTTRNLRGLAIAGTSGEAWAVGDSGTILHMEMDSWHLEPFVPEPPDAALYTVSFNSGTHGWAFGYKTFGARVALHFHDPLALEEGATAGVRPAPNTTVVRGVLSLPRSLTSYPQPLLLDITGRKSIDLHAGANDVSRLLPGVYFVSRGSAMTTTKVVLKR